jgi:hypothetical protein
MYAIAPHKVPDYDHNHYVDDVRIIRLAVNSLEQAREHGGVSRPTKIENNNHANSIKWPAGVDSVEVDSIPPERLQDLVRNAIEDVIDLDTWERSLEAEAKQRSAIADMVKGLKLE